jgi:tetratricopeptide (TPR) repeat protein
MKIIIPIVLLLIAASSLARGQTPSSTVNPNSSTEQERSPQWREAHEKLVDAAIAYKKGDFKEAQRLSEEALRLNPANEQAQFFIARSIHSQYKQGIETPENRKVALDAIEAYKFILNKIDRNNYESYRAVAALYGFIGEYEMQRRWIEQRAEDKSVESAQRAEAYTFLASKDWDCSLQITDRKENQKPIKIRGKTYIQYLKPKDPRDFESIRECTSQGLDYIEKAISLAPNFSKAWGYKGNLLYEMAKIFNMEGQREQQAKYRKLGDGAWERSKALDEAGTK